jgi:threonine aldolase
VIVPLEIMRQVVKIAHDCGAKAHLDGARIWNAAAATGIPLYDWVAGFDSVSVCLSKGMGAPVGSMILGTKEFITRARRSRKRFGGGMRQVGILAAACIWAIDDQLPKLVDDHKRAKRLAKGIADLRGVRLIPDPPPTNIVVIDLAERNADPNRILAALKERGVLLVGFGESRIRAVTHRDIGDDDIEIAIKELREALK